MMALSVLWTFGAGLSIFIYSISELEGSLKGLTGRPFKKFLHRQTAHPLRAVAAGAFVTALLQSSSVVMLLTLSFVGAGVLSTRNALALTIGSNIGTTLDSWLIALIGFKFDIESFAFPILSLALLLRVFRRDRTLVDRWFRFLLSFGLLFSALSLMKSSLGAQSALQALSVNASLNPYVFVFVGFVLTSIIQSSFATVAISLAALHAGIFNLPQAAGLVLGAEAGTAIKFLFGVNSRPVDAKRLAWGNFLINVMTVLLGSFFLFPLVRFLSEELFPGEVLMALVGFQTSMNLLSFILIFPFIGNFSTWLESRIKDEGVAEKDLPIKLLSGAAYDDLQDAILCLTRRCEALIRHATGAAESEHRDAPDSIGWKAFLLKRKSFLEEYRTLKHIHGVILEELSDHLVSEADNSEYEKWSLMVNVITNILHASKTVKDIRPDIKELRDSANDHLYGVLPGIVSDCDSFLEKVRTMQKEFSLEEELESNRRWHIERVGGAMELLQQHKIKEYESSTLINVYHELYSSRKALLRAYSGLRKIELISGPSTSALEVQ
ncbi:MAG: Na/Pi cotransporter family protein [Bacteroidota bacterium]